MNTRAKLLLGGLTVALVMAAAISSTSAHRLQSSEIIYRSTWGPIEFTAGGVTIRCDATIEHTLHSRTISKVSGLLIGNIDRVQITRPCTGGEAYFLNAVENLEGSIVPFRLPWHVRYASFNGALPRIERVRLQVIELALLLRVTILGMVLNCLYESTEARPAILILNVNTETGRVEGIEAESGSTIPRATGVAACPTTAVWRDRGVARSLTGEVITIRLVA